MVKRKSQLTERIMYMRRNYKNEEIKGVLSMNEARKRIRNKLFDYCFRTCFRIEFLNFNNEDRIKFKLQHSYFLEDSNPDDFEIEFVSYHFNKWVKRLGLKYTRSEIRTYVIEKMFND
ncbi:MAG: hypothetical protein ACKO6J_06915 [Crocinitomicaceae bacterium]